MNIQAIDVRSIDPPLFNSRLDPEGDEATLKGLGESLRTRQLEPIGVITINGGDRFRLVWGSRRVAAAKLVGLPTLNADVQPATTDADEVIANGIENLQRKELSAYESARLCAKLRDMKLSGKEVAAKLGISVQHVSNLALCFEKLPETVKGAWQRGEDGTDMNFLRSILTREENGKKRDATEEEMVAEFTERQASLAAVTGDEEDSEDDDDDDDDADDKPAPDKKYTVNALRYNKLLKALRAARAAQVTIDACRYLVGDIEKIRGIPLGNEDNPTKKTNKKEGK